MVEMLHDCTERTMIIYRLDHITQVINIDNREGNGVVWLAWGVDCSII